MKCVITVGVSASGKSTWSEKQEDFYEINRDKLRWEVTGKLGWKGENAYKFSSKVEKEVSDIADHLLVECAKRGEDVIFSNTNLNPKLRNKLIADCVSMGYNVEIVEFPVSFQEAVRRDKERGIFSVGEEVIYKQWEQWVAYWNEKEV